MDVQFKAKPCAICGNNDNFVPLAAVKDRRINYEVQTVICEECGLVFLNPGPTEDSYVNFYSTAMGSKMNQPSRVDLIQMKKNLATVFIAFLQRNITTLSSSKAVDVGSGWGGFLHFLRSEVKSLVSTEIMNGAKAFIEKEFNCPVFKVSRLRDAFGPESFDLITSTAVIEHYPDPFDALNDYFQALRPGGHLFLYTHDIKGMCFGLGPASYFKFVHPYYYSVNTLSLLLEKAGFSVVAHWTSKPALETRSLRYPLSVQPGDILLLARKDHAPGKKAPLVKVDSSGGILDHYLTAIRDYRQFEQARRLWLNHLSIPLRLISKLVPFRKQDRYLSMVRQYNRTFNASIKVSRNDFSQQFEKYLLSFYLKLARPSFRVKNA